MKPEVRFCTSKDGTKLAYTVSGAGPPIVRAPHWFSHLEHDWSNPAVRTWAVLALTCHIELFTQAHYRQSIDPDGELSELYKDVFLFHWKEESQHAILDEMEWQREDAKLKEPQREQAVTDLIELVAAVDGILQMQSAADVDYFLRVCGRAFDAKQVQQIRDTILKAYRWQYIVSGVQDERFQKILGGMITAAQMQRIGAALEPIVS